MGFGSRVWVLDLWAGIWVPGGFWLRVVGVCNLGTIL